MNLVITDIDDWQIILILQVAKTEIESVKQAIKELKQEWSEKDLDMYLSEFITQRLRKSRYNVNVVNFDIVGI